MNRIHISHHFFFFCSGHSSQVIFDDVEQKRENYDSIMKRREKLIEVMKTKDIEMNVSLDGLKGRRSFALKTDLMDA